MADKYLSAAGKRRKVYINTFEAFDELMADICRQKTSSYYSCHSTHSRWSLDKIISIKIFQFAMQNYKYERYSLYQLNYRRHPFTFPSGERGPRGAVNEENGVCTV